MDQAKFWGMIKRAHDKAAGDMDANCEHIGEAIARLPAADAVNFYRAYRKLAVSAYTHSLWGAATLIGGGCGLEAFTRFCAVLISRGQAGFEAALADPDSLADDPAEPDSWFHDGYLYAVMDAVEAAAGEISDLRAATVPTLSGVEWQKDQLPTLYPKLFAKFG